jgi:hypothetical protein
MYQAEAIRLSATNQLITGIQLNQLLANAEAECGQLTESDDIELEEDDG